MLLSENAIQNQIKELPQWEVHNKSIRSTFKLASFTHAVVWIAAIAQLAEAANHHPDMSLFDYKYVTVTLSTHSDGGLTDKDFELARQIDRLPHKKIIK